MKITRRQLRQIIKEEISRISEVDRDPFADPKTSATKAVGKVTTGMSAGGSLIAVPSGAGMIPLLGIAGLGIGALAAGIGLETKELIKNIKDENSAKAYVDATTRAIANAIKRAKREGTITQAERTEYHGLIRAMKLGKVRDPKARAMIMGDMLELVEKEDVAYAKSGILDSGEAMVDVDAVRADLDIWWNMIKNKYDPYGLGKSAGEEAMEIEAEQGG